MSRKPEKTGGGMVAFFLVHVVCCGGVLLLATGALGAFGAWFVADGLIWLAVAGAAAAVAWLLYSRRRADLEPVARATKRRPPRRVPLLAPAAERRRDGD
jgi:hypothetical protein